MKCKTLNEQYTEAVQNYEEMANVCSEILDRVTNSDDDDATKGILLLENIEYLDMLSKQGKEVKRLNGILLNVRKLEKSLVNSH